MQRGAEIIALTHQQIEALDAERDKADAGSGGDGTRGDAAVGVARADSLSDVRACGRHKGGAKVADRQTVTFEQA